MSLLQNTYYLNVDSRYRDINEYTNPTDFSVSFSRFQGTGTFVEGEPVNNSSYFQECSIDPDYDNTNLYISNSQIINYTSSNNTVYISGVFLSTGTLTVSYSGNTIINIPSMTNVPFLFQFSYVETALVPYVFNWIVYLNPTSSLYSNITYKASFRITSINTIYFLFDFTCASSYLTLINKIGTYSLDTFINTSALGSTCMATFLLNSDGTLGSVDGHSWGKHIISSNYPLLPSIPEIGNISLDTDSADNFYLSGNINPFKFNPPSFSASTSNLYVPTRELYQQGAIYYTTGSTSYFLTCAWNIWGNGIGETAVRVLASSCQIGCNKDYGSTGLGPTNIINTTTGTFAPDLQQSFVNATFFTGTNNNLFWVVGYAGTGFGTSGQFLLPNTVRIYKVNPEPLSVTQLVSIPRNQSSCVSYTKQGGYTYISMCSATGYYSCYKFDDVAMTGTIVGNLTLPITYIGIQVINSVTINNKVYTFVCERNNNIGSPLIIPLPPVTDTANIWVIEYDPGTNTLAVIKQLSSVSTFMCLIQQRSPTECYLICRPKNDAYLRFYNISNPYNPFLVTKFSENGAVQILQHARTDNGVTRYYVIQTQRSIGYFMDVTDLNNIVYIGNTYTNMQIYVVTPDGYLYGQVQDLNNVLGSKPMTKYLSFLQPVSLTTTHFNKNLQNLIYVGTGTNRCQTFNIDNQSYCAFVSTTLFSIYNVSNINLIYFYSSFTLTIGSTPIDFRTIRYKDIQYFLVSTQHQMFLYKLTDDLLNLTFISSSSFLATLILESSIYYNPITDNLYVAVITTPNTLINYLADPTTSTIIQISTISPRSPANIKEGTIVPYYYDNLNIMSLVYNDSQVSYIQNTSPIMYIYNVSNPSSFILYSTGNGRVPRPPQTGKIFKTKDNIVYYYANGEQFSFTFDITNPLNILNPWNTLGNVSRYEYPYANCRTAVIANSTNTYLFINRYGGTGGGGDYLFAEAFINYSNFSQPLFNNYIRCTNATTGSTGGLTNPTGTDICCLDLQISSNGNSYYLISLNDDGTFYAYDVSNPVFAGTTQLTSTTLKNYTTPISAGSSFSLRLSYKGYDDWLNWMRGYINETTSVGQMINSNRIRVNKNTSKGYISGIWKTQIQLYNPNSTGPCNQLNTLEGPTQNGFIASFDIESGEWNWILNISGDSDDYINRILVLDNNNLTICGNTRSTYVNIYNPQVSGNLVNPTTISSIIKGNTSTSSSFICVLDKDGKFVWYNALYTTDDNRDVYPSSIYSNSSNIVFVGYSNANILSSITSEGTNNPYLYFPSLNPSNQFGIFVYLFDYLGNYIKSFNILLAQKNKLTLDDIRIISDKYQIIISPTVVSQINLPTTTSNFNSDGTLGGTNNILPLQTVGTITSYNYNSYFIDTNGSQYSQIVSRSPSSYYFTGSYFTNYNMFIMNNPNSTSINKSFSVRDNTSDGIFILNSIVKNSLLDRSFLNVNGNTSYYTYSLSVAPLNSIINYSVTGTNTIIVNQLYGSSFSSNKTYYLTYPNSTGTTYIPISNYYTNTGGNVVLNVNTSLLTYTGSYIYVTKQNPAIYYSLQFNPTSINSFVYYTVQLNNLIIPNRPIREAEGNSIKNLSDMPCFYVAVYSTDSNNNINNNLVNIVYDNNPARENYAIFQIPTTTPSTNTYYTNYSSNFTPKIRFSPGYYSLGFKILDNFGVPIIFDNTPYKTIDSSFIGSVVPDYYMNVNINLTLTKYNG